VALDRPDRDHLGSVGVIGLVYACVVARRLLRQAAYRLGFEDWLFYGVLPFLAYLVLILSPFTALRHERAAVFAVGAATLLILFAGIHNSWDSISYHVFVMRAKDAAAPRRDQATIFVSPPSDAIAATIFSTTRSISARSVPRTTSVAPSRPSRLNG